MMPNTLNCSRSLRSIVSFVSALLLLSGLARAAGLSEAQQREISQLATAALKERELPGLSVAVAKDERIWAAGFGSADLEQSTPVSAQTMFRTASIAKWLTATAAMRLVERGTLDLDAPVQQYCPRFPKKKWPVTSRQLLTHTAGVRHYYGENGEKPETAAERQALEDKIRREKAGQYTRYTDVLGPLDVFKDDPLLFQPGTKTAYTSLGYRLLGCVLEGAARAPYRKLMRELVFEPAQMTAITEDDAQAIVPHRAAGYSKAADGKLIRAAFRDVSENLPAGGYLSTADDLVRFALAFEAGKLVTDATRGQMLQHPRLIDGSLAPDPGGFPDFYYGVGIAVGPDSRPAWFHAGGQSGVSGYLMWFPDTKIAVALLTNRDGNAIPWALVHRIEAIAAR
jgi:serine beta-lactamase-like protein LACTB, mitochondrial